MGRPKGSKNKPKAGVAETIPTAEPITQPEKGAPTRRAKTKKSKKPEQDRPVARPSSTYLDTAEHRKWLKEYEAAWAKNADKIKERKKHESNSHESNSIEHDNGAVLDPTPTHEKVRRVQKVAKKSQKRRHTPAL